jgi:hypothetical protein
MKNRKEAEATLSAQLQKPAHGPTWQISELVRRSPPRWCVGPASQGHVTFSLLPLIPLLSLSSGNGRSYSPRWFLTVMAIKTRHKSPQRSSVDSLSSSNSRCRRIEEIARQSPQHLRAYPLNSGYSGEPEPLPLLLSSSPLSGAPSWPFSWSSHAANRRRLHRLHLTDTASLSSLASSLFQEEFDAAIHTYELAVIFCAPSSTP